MSSRLSGRQPVAVRAALAAVAAAALVVGSGCSFVASSKSSSKSVSSPFTSSSASMGSGADESVSYQTETESYTRAFAAAGEGSAESFQRGLSRLAAEQGISDWEASSATWLSVGRGLAAADLPQGEAMERAQAWSGGRPEVAALVLQGYSGR
jgi:hypothetical protein